MATKRRRFLAFLKNEPPQRYYVGMQFLMLLGIMIVLVAVTYQLFQHFISAVSAIELSKPAFEYHLKDLFEELSVRIVIVFALGFVITALIGLAFLHRVTGPMVRVRNVISDIADGKFFEGMVQFRRGDFSKEFEAVLGRLRHFLSRGKGSNKPSSE